MPTRILPDSRTIYRSGVVLLCALFALLGVGCDSSTQSEPVPPHSAASSRPHSGTREVPGSAEEWLDRCIAYHDPDGTWDNAIYWFELVETDAAGKVLERKLVIDNRQEQFHSVTINADPKLTVSYRDGYFSVNVGETLHAPPELRARHGLSDEELVELRDAYTYLYGLPMKLQDPGTPLAPTVQKREFGGRDTVVLQVDYPRTGGGKTWWFYLDPETAALVGCRFCRDTPKLDGEYIVFEGEATTGNYRFPKKRSWYRNRDDQFVGTNSIRLLTTFGD